MSFDSNEFLRLTDRIEGMYSVYTHELLKRETDGAKYQTTVYTLKDGKPDRTLHSARHANRKQAVDTHNSYVEFYKKEAGQRRYDTCPKCGFIHGDGGCLE